MIVKTLTTEDFTDTAIVDADDEGNLTEVVDATSVNFTIVIAKINELIEALNTVTKVNE